MYVKTDFLLALIKDDDWLSDAAEAVFDEHREELWTSQFTLIELLLIAYREALDAERVISNAIDLVEVRGNEDAVLAAAVYIDDHGFTPFDALHLVESARDTIVSSDAAYESFALLLDLTTITDT